MKESNPNRKNKDVSILVKQMFAEYLQKGNHRKTPERFAILEKIYSFDEHFDIDKLYRLMKEDKYRVSRATLYNTIDLLIGSKLVVKHQFGTNIAQYEKAFSVDQHDHLICTTCGKIEETKGLSLSNIIKPRSISNFEPSHYSLYIYGQCSSCVPKADKE